MNEEKYKCPFTTCAFGMGLAGRGCCTPMSLGDKADPRNPNCPEYMTEDELLERMDTHTL